MTEQKPKKKPFWKSTVFIFLGTVVLLTLSLNLLASIGGKPSGEFEPYKPGEHPGMKKIASQRANEIRRQITARGHECPPPAVVNENLRTGLFEILCNGTQFYDVTINSGGRVTNVK